MLPAVRAFFRYPLGSGVWGMAGYRLWTVVNRGGNRDRGVGITGRQASLRAVQQESQEKEGERKDLTEPMHALRLARKPGDLNAGAAGPGRRLLLLFKEASHFGV